MTDPADIGASMSIDAAYSLLYGRPASPEVLSQLRASLCRDKVETLPALRSVLMQLDRQVHPSPATVRFGQDDLRAIETEGFRLLLDTADASVSAPILLGHRYEPHLSSVFRRYIKPGWRVADVGANVGYFTLLAASIVGPGGEVLAFEPNSENARLILLNAAENGFSQITLHPLALSDRLGYAYFSSFVGSNGGFLVGHQLQLADGRGVVVPTARLDELVRSRLDFMKLDVEGAEYRVLQGASGLLSSARPIVTIEFSCEMVTRVSGVEPRAVLALFLAHGYSIHLIEKPTGHLQAIDDIDEMLASWGSWDRIEDFLMLPRGSQVLQPA